MSEPTTLKRSYLVQRLRKPRGSSLLGVDNPFAFGGGYKNGGLSDEAMGLLRGIFAFDYMGSAEFEFGAVPRALQDVAKDAEQLVADTFEIPLSEVAPNWRDKTKEPPPGAATVYVLCRGDDVREVESRIREWARVAYAADLKEDTCLSGTLRPFSEWDGEVVGWLELDNGFFFFTDWDMWTATAALFGVEAAVSV